MRAMNFPQWSSWTAPIYMILSILSGVLLAAGHHLFYSGLAGSQAPNGVYHIVGNDVSKQQFNIAVGTMFAFLVKASLTLAVSIAYTQAFWHAAKGSRGGSHLSTLDVIYTALTNVLAFIQVHIWVKYPLLLLLGTIVWLVPLASIITPSTLSVETAPQVPAFSNMTTVPQLGFSSMNYLNAMPLAGEGGPQSKDYSYTGPNLDVNRVAIAVGAQGRILDIPIQAPNASWSLTFSAPALKCENVEGQEREDIWANILQYVKNFEHCDDSPAYIAWAPSPRHVGPYDVDERSALNWTLQEPDETRPGLNAFYFTILPRMFTGLVSLPSHTLAGGCALATYVRDSNLTTPQMLKDDYVNAFFGNSTLLQCGYRNASYNADFTVINGQQDIKIQMETSGDILERLATVTGPRSLSNNGVGNFSKPYDQLGNFNCSTLNTVHKDCFFDIEVARRLSFQAVTDAFTALVSGQIGFDYLSHGWTPIVKYMTELSKTVLLDTEDLTFIRTWAMTATFVDLSTLMQMGNGTDYVGLRNNKTTGTRGLLKDAFEEMFTNMTISLMSEPNLWPNYTSQFSPTKLVNVTYPTHHNIYVYAETTLWIAYGLAIAFSLLAVALGVLMLCLNGAAYDTSFSTVLRVSRTARMTEEVHAGEGDGSLPLPRRLGKAKVVLVNSHDSLSASEKGGSESTSLNETEVGGDSTRRPNANDALLQDGGRRLF